MQRRQFIGGSALIATAGAVGLLGIGHITNIEAAAPTPTLPTVDAFEGDWILSQSSGTDNVTSSLFLGPAGARILISLLPMESGEYYPFEPIKNQAVDLARIISGAGYEALDTTSTGLDQRLPLPKSIQYTYRYEGRDLIWGEPYAIGAYAAGIDIAVIVAITGTVNSLRGAEAMDSIALDVLGISAD